jgi:enamine deaminase RidA (YjgF/YER057c/UK114 family)
MDGGLCSTATRRPALFATPVHDAALSPTQENPMTPVQRLNIGPRMSDVVIHNGVAYLAGKVPAKGIESVGDQTRDVLATIDKLLAQAGTSKDRILRAEIFLADIKDFEQMNKVWDAWVPAGATPARATVEAKLANPDFKVEIVITAAV